MEHVNRHELVGVLTGFKRFSEKACSFKVQVEGKDFKGIPTVNTVPVKAFGTKTVKDLESTPFMSTIQCHNKIKYNKFNDKWSLEAHLSTFKVLEEPRELGDNEDIPF